MKQWEYLSVNRDSVMQVAEVQPVLTAGFRLNRLPGAEDVLNALGAEGWELIDSVGFSSGY
ncbi:MAG: hypothetical protein ACRDJH_11050 [Thermomicrobiales bacterium]